MYDLQPSGPFLKEERAIFNFLAALTKICQKWGGGCVPGAKSATGHSFETK